MKKLCILLSLCLLIVSLSACGSNQSNIKKTVEAFDTETSPLVAKEDQELIINSWKQKSNQNTEDNGMTSAVDSGIAMGIILEEGNSSDVLNLIAKNQLKSISLN